MNDKLRQSFEEQLVYLPEINQQALKSFDWATELLSIGKNYGLHIDELEDLQVETMLVMVGLVQVKDYPNELINKLAISPAEANKIIEQVNDRIFQPIHDYIVNGGPKVVTTPTGVMESAGFEITDDDAPVVTKTDNFTRVGGVASPMQTIIADDVKPVPQSIPVQPIISTETTPAPVTVSGTTPLQFHPEEEKSTTPSIPVQPIISTETTPALITLSKEKLEAMYHDRQKTIDATLQSMDQVS